MHSLFTRSQSTSAAAKRGQVLLVHGFGEHSGRYQHVAQFFVAQGFDVHAYDHYGHGQSHGKRGDLVQRMQLVEDLAAQIERVKALAPELPLVLLGHSMGGTVAAHLAAHFVHQSQTALPYALKNPIDALILSSPALAVRMNWLNKLQMAILPKLVPHVTVQVPFDPSKICTDPAVVQAYLNDPLVHGGISPILGRYIYDAGHVVRTVASNWTTPTLLVYAQTDDVVDPAGSQAFAGAAPKALVQSNSFAGMHHEIMNETNRQAVFAVIEQWLKSNNSQWANNA